MCKRRVGMKWGVGLAIAMAASGAATAGEGLTAPDFGGFWPQWQARITISTARWTPLSLSSVLDPGGAPSPVQSGAVLGDFYLDTQGLRLPQSLGGLRASSGVLFGPRGLAPGAGIALPGGERFGLAVQQLSALPASENAASDAVPYLGLGYTGLLLKGSFSITADVGVVAERPGQLGRALLGTQGLERSLRELRLSPVLQLGVRYAF